jgi:SpoVK/Ycf46/Vps4 family AAA+-type ATPase
VPQPKTFDLTWLREAIRRNPERREELIKAQRDFERAWKEAGNDARRLSRLEAAQ